MKINHSKTCPNHDMNKKCNVEGCNNLGMSKGKCPFCGNPRRRSVCHIHKYQTTPLKKRKIKNKKDFCEICFTKSDLTIHHIDGNNKNNKKENYLTLCRSCHDVVHGMGGTLRSKAMYFLYKKQTKR